MRDDLFSSSLRDLHRLAEEDYLRGFLAGAGEKRLAFLNGTAEGLAIAVGALDHVDALEVRVGVSLDFSARLEEAFAGLDHAREALGVARSL